MHDPSDLVDAWFRAHNSSVSMNDLIQCQKCNLDIDPDLSEHEYHAMAQEHKEAGCEHRCFGCHFTQRAVNGDGAICAADNQVVGWQAYDGSCFESYIKYFDGEYDCDGCGAKTPANGNAILVLCPRCLAKSNLILP